MSPCAARGNPGPVHDPGRGRGDLLREEVFARLLHDVLVGTYRRGSRVSVERLATVFGVSRTPVREALVPLEALGLVRVQRYVGVVVEPWSVAGMMERVDLAVLLLAGRPRPSDVVPCRFDPRALDDCLTEAGQFVELTVWVTRHRGAEIGADWMRLQRTVLDVFYSAEVAGASGIDAAVGRAQRASLAARAREAAEAGEIDRCAACLRRLGAALIELAEPARSREARGA